MVLSQLRRAMQVMHFKCLLNGHRLIYFTMQNDNVASNGAAFRDALAISAYTDLPSSSVTRFNANQRRQSYKISAIFGQHLVRKCWSEMIQYLFLGQEFNINESNLRNEQILQFYFWNFYCFVFFFFIPHTGVVQFFFLIHLFIQF